MFKTSTLIKIYVEQLIKKANTKDDFQEACYFIYESLTKKYGFDKAQAILEIIENEYNITLEY